MDSTFQSRRNHQNRGLEVFEAGGCDITSLIFHRSGQYGFDITVHGRFIPPTSQKIDTIPPLELPEPAIDALSVIGHDEDSILGDPGGLKALFSNGVRNAALENKGLKTTPSNANGFNTNLGPVPKEPVHASFRFNFDFSTQVEKVPLQMIPEQQTENYQTTVNRPSSGDSHRKDPNEIFSGNEPGQYMNFLESFDANPDFPTFSQDTGFSSNKFSYFYDVEAIPTAPLASPETGFSSSEFNFSDSVPRSSPEIPFSSASSSSSSSSNLTTASSPITLTTTPTTPISPDGYLCNRCLSTFTRPSDLKRHEGVHNPGQWVYHCKQLGCRRKGGKGFYRRDKLKAHERQVHGLGG